MTKTTAIVAKIIPDAGSYMSELPVASVCLVDELLKRRHSVRRIDDAGSAAHKHSDTQRLCYLFLSGARFERITDMVCDAAVAACGNTDRQGHQLFHLRIQSAIVTTDRHAALPGKALLRGETAELKPIDPAQHAADFYAASHQATDPAVLWRYMSYQPFADVKAFAIWLGEASASVDPLYFAVRDRQRGQVHGMVSYLRITPSHRVIDISAIWLGPELQRTRQSTEALFVMMCHALDDLGYRRLEPMQVPQASSESIIFLGLAQKEGHQSK